MTIFAEYTSGQFPTVYKGYPSGQELLIELCNLNLELRDKPLKECAEILIRWSLENIHPYYHYGDDVAALEQIDNDADQYWDMLVNVIECYSISVKDMVQDLERLYTDTMTLFAIRSLMEGKITDAQRIYGEVRVPDEVILPIKDEADLVCDGLWQIQNCFAFATWNWTEDGFKVTGTEL